jgi:hypothetical protein
MDGCPREPLPGRMRFLSPLPGMRVKLSTTVRNCVNVFFKDADER